MEELFDLVTEERWNFNSEKWNEDILGRGDKKLRPRNENMGMMDGLNGAEGVLEGLRHN